MDAFTCDRLRACGVPQQRISNGNLGKLNLSHQDLSGCDLRGILVTETNFEGCDFRGADLRTVVFATSNCNGARFCGADMRGVNLALGYFHNADFRGADLRGAVLTDSICNESRFAGADLRGAVLGSEVYDSDFRGADLRGIDMPGNLELHHLSCDVRAALVTPKEVEKIHNKRKHPRIPLSHRVNVYEQRSMRPLGIAADISCGGLRLVGPAPLVLGEEITVRIAFPSEMGFRATEIDVVAKSVWSRKSDSSDRHFTGLAFKRISDAGMAILGELVRQHGESK